MCRLGGYENRLLGYRTRLDNLCKTFSCSEDIDTIMFGKRNCTNIVLQYTVEPPTYIIILQTPQGFI